MTDLNDFGRVIFEGIRDMPYRLPEFPGDEAPNCALKGKLLLERLGTIGFAVRGRLVGMDWRDTPLPEDILSLYPPDIAPTHFYVEALINDTWCALDPSWDIGLKKAGFSIATFAGDNAPGLPVHQVFQVKEQANFFATWSKAERIDDYFVKASAFLRAANRWFEDVRYTGVYGEDVEHAHASR